MNLKVGGDERNRGRSASSETARTFRPDPREMQRIIYAARYTRFLAFVLIVYGLLTIFFAVQALPRRASTPDKLIRVTIVSVIVGIPVLLCFAFAANYTIGKAWAVISGIVLSSLISLFLLFVVIVAVLGLPQSMVTLLIAVIPLILSVASIVYTSLALGSVLRFRSAGQRGFDVLPAVSEPPIAPLK